MDTPFPRKRPGGCRATRAWSGLPRPRAAKCTTARHSTTPYSTSGGGHERFRPRSGGPSRPETVDADSRAVGSVSRRPTT